MVDPEISGNTKTAVSVSPIVALSLLGSVIFMLLAAWHIDWKKVSEALQFAHWYPWIPLAICSYLLGQLVRGLRLKLLVTNDATLSLATASNIVVVGYAVNNIAPARLGEFVRAGLLAERTGFPFARSLAITFLERLFDGVAILLLLIVPACFLSLQIWIQQVALVASAILVLALSMVLFATITPQFLIALVSRFTSRLKASWHNRLLAVVTQACWGLRCLESPLQAAQIFAVSILVWTLESGLYLFCLPCFGFNLHPAQAMVVMAVTNLGILLPSSPGFIGPFHYFCMQTLMTFGAQSAQAFSYALIVHLGFYIPVTLWGAAAMARYGMELGSMALLSSKAAHVPGLSADEMQLQVLASSSNSDVPDLPADRFWQAMCQALMTTADLPLDDVRRTVLFSEVPGFVRQQLRCLPWRLRVLLSLGLFLFQSVVFMTRLRSFASLPLSDRAAIVSWWAWGPLSLTRQLFRPLRSLTLYAFLEAAPVRELLDAQQQASRRLNNAPE